ncbi:hypothetical protein NEAUS03_1711 [Nematocida ausubeli]|nr:hypothetical protein NEAUS03_1711 [Nematocida ausubeli]
MHPVLNPDMKKSFKQFESVDYSRHTPEEVFGFIKLHLMKSTGPLIKKQILKKIISPTYDKTQIPMIIKEIYVKNNIYNVRNIQILFCLLIYMYRSFKYNAISGMFLIGVFIPLFFGDEETAKLKKNNSQNYFVLINRWNDILKYLPKGSTQ